MAWRGSQPAIATRQLNFPLSLFLSCIPILVLLLICLYFSSFFFLFPSHLLRVSLFFFCIFTLVPRLHCCIDWRLFFFHFTSFVVYCWCPCLVSNSIILRYTFYFKIKRIWISIWFAFKKITPPPLSLSPFLYYFHSRDWKSMYTTHDCVLQLLANYQVLPPFSFQRTISRIDTQLKRRHWIHWIGPQ